MRSRIRCALAIACVLALFQGAFAQDSWIPSEGQDLVRLTDGRILRCQIGMKEDGKVPLTFPSGTLHVPAERIEETRLWRDFDSTPRDETEKEKAAKGLVRWDGKWVSAKKAAARRAAEQGVESSVRAENAAHAAWENRWQIETKHFRIEANITKAKVDFYMALLEDFYDHFTKHFQVKLTQREKKQKLPVYFFRLREEYVKKSSEDGGGSGEHTLGYFVPVKGAEELVLFDQPDGQEETLGVLFHEGTHFILHLAEPNVLLPRWIHEGCAEYFGGATYEDGKFTPGVVQDGRLLYFQQMVKSGKVLPIEKLIRTANGEFSQEKFGGPEYAQAWTLVHFFMRYKKGKYRSKFTNFLKACLTGRGVKYTPYEASERKYIDLAEMTRLLRKSLKVKNLEDLNEELAEYALSLPMRGAVAYVERGQTYYWNDNDKEAAFADFDTAHERGKDDPYLLYRLATAYRPIPERREQVLPLFKRALELDPLDVRTRYAFSRHLEPAEGIPQLRLCIELDPERGGAMADLAWLLYIEKVQDSFRAETEEDKAVVAEALQLAEQAIELDPDHGVFDTLGALYICTGDFAQAEANQKRASQMRPENVRYQRRLGLIHAVQGNATEFARTMRRAHNELTRRSGDNPSEAVIAAFTWDTINSAIECCYRWEKEKECAKAVQAWYSRMPPKLEQEWWVYVRLLIDADDYKRAAQVVARGKAAFPDSALLKDIGRELDSYRESVGGGDDDPEDSDE